MLPTKDLRELQGRPLIAADGDKLGGIEEIYCDKATNEPEWFGINTGFLGTKRLVVPVEGATFADDGIHVPYTSAVVKDAPGVDMKEISIEEESELYRHYGIRVSSADSPTLLPDSEPQTDAEMLAPEVDELTGVASPVLTPGTVQPIPSDAIDPARADPSSPPRDRWDIETATGTADDVPLNKSDSMHVRSAGTQPAQPQSDRQSRSARQPTGAVRAFVRDAPIRSMLTGAASGAIATLPMTAVMMGLQRILPGDDKQALPPRQITMHAAREAGTEPMQKTEGQRRMMTTLFHTGYGAANGAIYASTLANTKINPVVGGAAYGAGLWVAGYFGWLPASGLYPSARKLSRGRNAMMLATNMLWGIGAATMARRMRKPMREYRVTR